MQEKKYANSAEDPAQLPAGTFAWRDVVSFCEFNDYQIFEVVVLGFAFSLPKKHIVIWHENYDIMLLALQGPS